MWHLGEFEILSVGLCLRLLTYAGQAWRTESCPLCRTLSPPPPQSFHPPPHLLPLLPPPGDPPSPPRIGRPAESPPQENGVRMRRRGRRLRRGGELLVRVEQVQPWAGGGAGYLSQGTKEGGGSEGKKYYEPWQTCPMSTSNTFLLRSASESDLGTDSVDERLETLLQVILSATLLSFS